MRYHTVLLDKKEIQRKLLSPRSEKMKTYFQLNELKILCNKTLYTCGWAVLSSKGRRLNEIKHYILFYKADKCEHSPVVLILLKMNT